MASALISDRGRHAQLVAGHTAVGRMAPWNGCQMIDVTATGQTLLQRSPEMRLAQSLHPAQACEVEDASASEQPLENCNDGDPQACRQTEDQHGGLRNIHAVGVTVFSYPTVKLLGVRELINSRLGGGVTHDSVPRCLCDRVRYL
jgi:hypothetical protein